MGVIIPILAAPVLLIVIIIGLALSEPTESDTPQPGDLPQFVSRKTFNAAFLLPVGGIILALGLSSNNTQTIVAGAVMVLAGATLAVYSDIQRRSDRITGIHERRGDE